MAPRFTIKTHIFFPLAVAFATLFITFILGITYFEQKDLHQDVEIIIEKIQTSLTPQKIEIDHLSNLMTELQHMPPIIQAWQAKDRNALFRATEMYFNHLRDYHGAPYMHFIEPNKVCFLRMHNPQKYGDTFNRFTLDQAAKKHTVATGTELGNSDVLNFRLVSPWKINGKVVGYMEVGKNIGQLASETAHTLGAELVFCINKRFIDEKTWEKSLSKHQQGSPWNLLSHDVVASTTFHSLPPQLIRLIDQSIPKANELFQIKDENKIYLGSTLPLIDAKQQHIGDILVLCDVTSKKNIIAKAIAQVFLLCCLVGIILFILINMYLTRHENKLLHIQNELYATHHEAQKANRAKSDFLAMMSHDIRTPMNGVLGFTDLLLETDLNKEQRDYVQTIQSSGKTLLALLNDILDYTKIEANKLKLEQEPFNPAEEIRNVIKLQKAVADIKGLQLFADISSDVPEKIIGDRLRFNQILSNLVGNALKFTDQGKIKVTATTHERAPLTQKFLRLTICDTGIGISKEKIPLLFKPFSQVEQFNNTKRTGTGLGLAISKRLCELMGGSIHVQSEKGKGSSFEFSIPILNTQQKIHPHPATKTERSLKEQFANVFPLEILVAEDNPVNQKLMLTLLKRLGYKATLVENGLEVIDELERKNYDVILMDVQMPHLDGFETTHKIRNGEASENNRNIYICAISALAMPTDQDQCIQAGMDTYLSKPLNLDKLEEALQHISIKKPI